MIKCGGREKENGFDGCGKETVYVRKEITTGPSSHNMIYLSNL